MLFNNNFIFHLYFHVNSIDYEYLNLMEVFIFLIMNLHSPHSYYLILKYE
jgi:hypothetical protein